MHRVHFEHLGRFQTSEWNTLNRPWCRGAFAQKCAIWKSAPWCIWAYFWTLGVQANQMVNLGIFAQNRLKWKCIWADFGHINDSGRNFDGAFGHLHKIWALKKCTMVHLGWLHRFLAFSKKCSKCGPPSLFATKRRFVRRTQHPRFETKTRFFYP